MTRSEIIEHEGRYGLSIDSYFTLVYDLSPSSITRIMHGSFLENGPALLTYWLANNSLVSASYNYDTTEASADSFYVSLVEEMTTLYGEPAKYDDTQSDWLSCTWDLDRTKIVVVWDYRGETTKVSAKYYSLLFAGEENDPVNLYYAR